MQRSQPAAKALLSAGRAGGRAGGGSIGGQSDVVSMSGWLVTWLKHAYFRGYVSGMLNFQTAVLPNVWIRWVWPWRSYVSVFHLRIATQHPLLLVIRDNCIEVEGVYDGEGDLRWAKDSYTRIMRPEMPFFLEVLVNTEHRLSAKDTQDRLGAWTR
jgi:hypothetical protein